ncbi:hypothetical protein BgiMline_013072, partial [Biomphalaria glabrata]
MHYVLIPDNSLTKFLPFSKGSHVVLPMNGIYRHGSGAFASSCDKVSTRFRTWTRNSPPAVSHLS